ncbi:MAG: sulfatase [Verrucomicrobiae bacterium]|nr:sulfatase [Verrucomicrobiae bacterium]
MDTKTHSFFMRAFLLGALVISGSAGTDAAQARPFNVVLFVADDHGQDMGCYGNKVIQTPNMDRLAGEGTLFRNAFCTTASCSASRSVILSGLHNHANGQYGHQHSFHHFAAFGSVRSLPVILAEHGYRTARIGKFHVAPEAVFHFETVLPSGQGARHSVQMAENCREFIADKSKPFFLYFCVADPHRGGGKLKDKPGQPDAFGCNVKYAGMVDRTYDPKDVIVPAWLPDTPECRAELAQYSQAVSRIDEGIGRLVQLLKDAGQYERTVIIYTSDNGPAFPGAKTTLYEPGMKLPLIVRSPDQKKRGVVTDAMVSWVDITPTILDFAGVKEVIAPPLVQGDPEDMGGPKRGPGRKVQYNFHGRSFRSVLEQEKPEGWNEVFASHTFHEITMYYPMRVIRTDRYKLILNLAHQLPYPFASDLYESSTWQSVLKGDSTALYGKRRVSDYLQRPRYELYDLQNDPHEIVNLAARPEHKAVFDDLSARLKAYQQKTRDPWISKYEYE